MAARKRTAGKRGSTTPTDKDSSANSSDKKPRHPGVVQPHGGMLIPGAGGGRQPGAGRPRSAIRRDLLDGFDARHQFLGEVIDGELVTHLQVPLVSVLPHVQCSVDGCVGKIVPKDVKDLLLVNFSAKASASVGDRLKALDTQAKYALGALKGVLQDQVEENVRKTLDLLKLRLPPELFESVKRELQPIWSGH